MFKLIAQEGAPVKPPGAVVGAGGAVALALFVFFSSIMF